MVRVDVLKHQMRGHTHLNSVELTKGLKIMHLQTAEIALYARQIQMGIHSAPPMARNVFQNARHAPMPQPLMQRARMGDNRRQRMPIAPIFQHSMGVQLGNISQGRAIAINSAASQILSNQPPPQPKQPFGLGRGGLIQRWQKFKPMRRA